MNLLMKYVVVVACVAITGACNSAKKPEPSKAVEDLTGYSTIKTGEAMKKKIKEIEKMQEDRVKKADEIK